MYSDYYQLLSGTGLSARGFFELHNYEYLNGDWGHTIFKTPVSGQWSIIFSHISTFSTHDDLEPLNCWNCRLNKSCFRNLGAKNHQVGKNIWQLQAMIRQLSWYRLFYRRFQGPASGYMNSVQSGLKVTGAVFSPIQLQIQYN